MCASDARCALLSSHLSPLAVLPPITTVRHRSPPLITLHHNTHGLSPSLNLVNLKFVFLTSYGSFCSSNFDSFILEIFYVIAIFIVWFVVLIG